METFFEPTFLARLQFAITSLFHITWPAMTIGFSVILVILEALWIRTGTEMYYRLVKFWSKLFILNFGVGVASGVPLSFELGMNWAPYSYVSGDFIGNIMGYEASMAFMLEAGFLGIMIFGWNRVSKGMHLFATSMVALGASLSAFWIMVANSWMQTPTGVVMQGDRLFVEDYIAAIFSPNMPWGVSHMWFASLQTSVMVLGGISAWYLVRQRHVSFATLGLKIAIGTLMVVAPLQIWLGHGSGSNVLEHQPTKFAAIEAHWETNKPGEGAAWTILALPDEENGRNSWELSIPNALSVVATESLTGQVRGLNDFPKDERPPVTLIYYAFRVMVAMGFFMLGLALWSMWRWRKGWLSPERIVTNTWLLRAWVYGLPAGLIAVWAGWIVREVGRQPWVIYGIMRTNEGVSKLDASTLVGSLIAFVVIYGVLFAGFLYFAVKIIKKGPEFDSPLPHRDESTPPLVKESGVKRSGGVTPGEIDRSDSAGTKGDKS